MCTHTCMHIHIHLYKQLMKRRGQEFEREQGGVWGCLKLGKGVGSGIIISSNV